LLEEEIVARDKHCVYCGILMIDKSLDGAPRRTLANWEHIINDASIITRENIARCCAGCNSSKGTKELTTWLNSSYCKANGITENTVAEVVKSAIKAARDRVKNH